MVLCSTACRFKFQCTLKISTVDITCSNQSHSLSVSLLDRGNISETFALKRSVLSVVSAFVFKIHEVNCGWVVAPFRNALQNIGHWRKICMRYRYTLIQSVRRTDSVFAAACLYRVNNVVRKVFPLPIRGASLVRCLHCNINSLCSE